MFILNDLFLFIYLSYNLNNNYCINYVIKISNLII